MFSTDSTPTVSRTTALLVAAVWANLADVLVTLPAWDLEANPVVHALGAPLWIGLKAALLLALAVAWWAARNHRATAWVLAGAAGVGVVGVAGNTAAYGWLATDPGQLGVSTLAAGAIVVALLWHRPDPRPVLSSLRSTAPAARQTAAVVAAVVVVVSIAFAGIPLPGPVPNIGPAVGAAAAGPSPSYSENWSVSQPDVSAIRYVPSEDLVYVGSKAEDYVAALYPSNGTEKWNATGAVGPEGNVNQKTQVIAYNGGTIWVANGTDLVGLDARSGSETDRHTLSAKTKGNLYADGGYVYFWDQDLVLNKVDADTGSVADSTSGGLSHPFYKNGRFFARWSDSDNTWTYFEDAGGLTNFYNDSSTGNTYNVGALYKNGDGYVLDEGVNITYFENDGDGSFTKVADLTEDGPNQNSMQITQDNLTWYGNGGKLGALTADGEQYVTPEAVPDASNHKGAAAWHVAAFGNYTLFTRDDNTVYRKDTGINAEAPPAGNADVTGTVTTADGTPCSNCTVKAFGFEYEQYSGTTNEIKDEIATLKDKMNDPEPEVWSDQLNDSFQLTGDGGYIGNTDNQWVVAHAEDDWALRGPGDSSVINTQGDQIELGEPHVTFDEPQTIVLSLWESAGGLSIGQDAVDSDLPGRTTNGTVVVEQLGPEGSVVQNITQQTKPIVEVGPALPLSGTKHRAAKIGLSEGYYHVYPQNNPDADYYIKVGSPTRTWLRDLKAENNSLANRANAIDSRIANNKINQPVTTNTSEDGSFALNFDSSTVDEASIFAYKVPEGMDPNTTNRWDIVEYYNSMVYTDDGDLKASIDESKLNTTASYEQVGLPGAYYLPAERKSVAPGDTNVTIEVNEEPVPDYVDRDAKENVTDLTQNLTFSQSDPRSFAQQAWNNSNREFVEDFYSRGINATAVACEAPDREGQLSSVMLAFCEDLGSELTKDNETADTVDKLKTKIDEQDATIGNLTNRTLALQKALMEANKTIGTLEEQIDQLENASGDVTSTVTSVQLNGDFEKEGILATVHWSNGTTEVLDPEQISISQSTLDSLITDGETTTVNVEVPINGTDPPAAETEVTAVSEEGIANERVPFNNPANGTGTPKIKAIDASTLFPGPSETVEVSVEPTTDSSFDKLSSAEYVSPNGSTVNATVVNDRTARFTTDQAGVHVLKLTFTDSDGTPFVETVKLRATDRDRSQPPSIMVQQSNFGVYALAGENFESGDVSIADNGRDVSITAQIATDDDAPSDPIHVYADGLVLAPESTVSVRVVEGDSEKLVGERVGIAAHIESLPENALVTVNDEPTPKTEETAQGTTDREDGHMVVKSFTDQQGAATIAVNKNPSRLERLGYWISLNVPSIGPFGWIQPIPTPLLGAGPALVGFGGAAVVFGWRRRRSP